MIIQPKPQIAALTTTRAVAAIMVVIHHYGGAVYPFSLWPNIFNSGNLAVSYFFVLSGFVLYIAHADSEVNYRQFIKRRAARILPMYYLALLFTIYVVCQLPPLPANIKHQIAYSSLLLQAYIPGYALKLNGPAWSISVEMFFYLVFPFLLMLQQKNKIVFTVLTLVALVCAQYFHLKYFDQRFGLPDDITDPVFFSPYIHISQFMVGMLGGYLYKTTMHRYVVKWYLPILVFALIIALIAYRPDTVSYHVGLIAPLFMLLILCIAKRGSALLGRPFFVFMGEISFGVYILQYPVYRYMEILDKRFFSLSAPPFFIRQWWYCCCYAHCCIIP